MLVTAAAATVVATASALAPLELVARRRVPVATLVTRMHQVHGSRGWRPPQWRPLAATPALRLSIRDTDATLLSVDARVEAVALQPVQRHGRLVRIVELGKA